MTTIVFEIIRHQLLRGEGLPLGLVSSVYTVSKFDFFCKKTIWYWLRSPSSKWPRILVLSCMILLALFATLIGPASAVLILPRLTVSSFATARVRHELNLFSHLASSCIYSSILAKWEFGRLVSHNTDRSPYWQLPLFEQFRPCFLCKP